MFALTLLLMALSALSTALPTLTKKQTNCSVTPSSFIIEEFSTFTPSAGNPHASNLFFIFGDANYQTQCTSNISSNPVTPIACANSNIKYLWDGSNTLNIEETYNPCNA
jgi:hypothetical protein